jgi:TetR/AcrR family transcriptional regulator, cholesterol catabolism regulator
MNAHGSPTRFETRRLAIVDIAAGEFARHGYHATSLDDLCDATGLGRGGLYHYIGSKEQLLYAIHERFIDPLLAAAREVEARGASPEATLRGLAHVLIGVIADYNDQVTVFLHEWRSVAGKDERAVRVRQARRDFEAVVDRALRRGMDDGTFAPGKPELSGLAFLGMINYAYQWYRPDAGYTAPEVADVFCDIFLRGVMKR